MNRIADFLFTKKIYVFKGWTYLFYSNLSRFLNKYQGISARSALCFRARDYIVSSTVSFILI